MTFRTLSEERFVAGEPAAVYDAVSDLARMVSWSEERWEDLRGTGPAGGFARWLGRAFTGTSVQERVERNSVGMRATLRQPSEEIQPDSAEMESR